LHGPLNRLLARSVCGQHLLLLLPRAGVFENAIDMAHIHYLHNDSFGNSEKPRIHDMTTTRDTFHVEANFRWAAVQSCCTVADTQALCIMASSSAGCSLSPLGT
jgi:hypothetical protein